MSIYVTGHTVEGRRHQLDLDLVVGGVLGLGGAQGLLDGVDVDLDGVVHEGGGLLPGTGRGGLLGLRRRGALGGGGGGGGGGGSSGGGGGDGVNMARERAWKDKNKASRGNHGRKRGHDKKMARAGAGPST